VRQQQDERMAARLACFYTAGGSLSDMRQAHSKTGNLADEGMFVLLLPVSQTLMRTQLVLAA
jgi:hypothetical protein